jgi:gamma-glutamyltranspeptidase/glutathione hydrolase
MDDFSIKPGIPNMYGLTGGEANSIEPGKRMLSSMSPTIVLRGGELFLVLGTPGGSTIITTVAQVIVNIVDYCMEPGDAVRASRFHHQWLPDRISFERELFTEDLIARLNGRGHDCAKRTGAIGDLQLILIENGSLHGIADPRGGGTAEGIDYRRPER